MVLASAYIQRQLTARPTPTVTKETESPANDSTSTVFTRSLPVDDSPTLLYLRPVRVSHGPCVASFLPLRNDPPAFTWRLPGVRAIFRGPLGGPALVARAPLATTRTGPRAGREGYRSSGLRATQSSSLSFPISSSFFATPGERPQPSCSFLSCQVSVSLRCLPSLPFSTRTEETIIAVPRLYLASFAGLDEHSWNGRLGYICI